jgi:hypothetical protein
MIDYWPNYALGGLLVVAAAVTLYRGSFRDSTHAGRYDRSSATLWAVIWTTIAALLIGSAWLELPAAGFLFDLFRNVGS